MDDPAELNMEAWPAEVAFVPYVGRGYWKGVEGRRVLLLGESHYREAGWTDAPVITRPFTRKTFGDMETCNRKGGGKFFDELDRLLTGQSRPNVVDAANAWQHVAFCNLSQCFAGTRAGHRPSGTDFNHGGASAGRGGPTHSPARRDTRSWAHCLAKIRSREAVGPAKLPCEPCQLRGQEAALSGGAQRMVSRLRQGMGVDDLGLPSILERRPLGSSCRSSEASFEIRE